MYVCIYMYIYTHTHTHMHMHTDTDTALHTAHIVFIHITSMGKSVHIFMARNRVSKSSLMFNG